MTKPILKISVNIQSPEKVAEAISDFLVENALVNWTVERDALSGEHLLCGYVDDEHAWQPELAAIKDKFAEVGEATRKKLNKTDWAEEYKKYLKPWQCENLFWIPSHLKDQVKLPDGAIDVYIDPGMAFGTGTHQTTRLCGRALIMFKNLYEKTGELIIKNCIDIGCGSGILGISALKLGFVHATMMDIDPDAVRISQENAKANGLFSDQMTFVTGDVKTNLLGRQGDVIMANIMADILIENANLLVSSVKDGGILCLSGILKSEKAAVAKVFSRFVKKHWNSFLDNSIDDDQWSALAYFRL